MASLPPVLSLCIRCNSPTAYGLQKKYLFFARLSSSSVERTVRRPREHDVLTGIFIHFFSFAVSSNDFDLTLTFCPDLPADFGEFIDNCATRADMNEFMHTLLISSSITYLYRVYSIVWLCDCYCCLCCYCSYCCRCPCCGCCCTSAYQIEQFVSFSMWNPPLTLRLYSTLKPYLIGGNEFWPNVTECSYKH